MKILKEKVVLIVHILCIYFLPNRLILLQF